MAQVAPLPTSLEMKDMDRHAGAIDPNVNELDFNYSFDATKYPRDDVSSLQQVFDVIEYQQHFAKEDNFSPQTVVECLRVTSEGKRKLRLVLNFHTTTAI